jgi:transcriptional regulator with XRE-family HTH domain
MNRDLTQSRFELFISFKDLINQRAMVPTSDQFRAARAMLGLDQQGLAEAAGVSLATVRRAESGGHDNVSPENLAAIRSVLERLGLLFIEHGSAAPMGGVGVRFANFAEPTPQTRAQPAPRHGKVVISTQQEWERVRPRALTEGSIREFLRRWGFNPDSRIERGLGTVSEAAKPRAGTIRREIYDRCFDTPGRSVREVNQIAREIGGASVRKDADLCIGLHTGYVRLSGAGPTGQGRNKR